MMDRIALHSYTRRAYVELFEARDNKVRTWLSQEGVSRSFSRLLTDAVQKEALRAVRAAVDSADTEARLSLNLMKIAKMVWDKAKQHIKENFSVEDIVHGLKLVALNGGYPVRGNILVVSVLIGEEELPVHDPAIDDDSEEVTDPPAPPTIFPIERLVKLNLHTFEDKLGSGDYDSDLLVVLRAEKAQHNEGEGRDGAITFIKRRIAMLRGILDQTDAEIESGTQE